MSAFAHFLDTRQIGLGLYIHIPWCIKKCPYCDFNSHTLPDNTPFADYVTALIQDAKAQAPLVRGRVIDSIFIGGGTPSLLPIWAYEQLFAELKQLLPISSTCEITLEANPATLEHAPFVEYLNVGINRLSLGVQTFDETALRALGRIHTKDHAISAITNAKNAGFKRINVDIMHGLPKQTPSLAQADLEYAHTLGATHLSWYQLTIEPNTAFYRSPPDLPDETTMEAIETAGRAYLLGAGYHNYEVSAWVGANDSPCRHNVNYWKFGDYLAIGAGAHGKITLPNDERLVILGLKPSDCPKMGVYRFAKSRSPKDYLTYESYPKFVQVANIAQADLVGEFMMNALRLADGVSVREFECATGIEVSAIDNELIPLQHQGLMVAGLDRLAPTPLGFCYVNHLVQAFL